MKRKDIGRIKELVKDAQFYCKHCGRAAHEKAIFATRQASKELFGAKEV